MGRRRADGMDTAAAPARALNASSDRSRHRPVLGVGPRRAHVERADGCPVPGLGLARRLHCHSPSWRSAFMPGSPSPRHRRSWSPGRADRRSRLRPRAAPGTILGSIVLGMARATSEGVFFQRLRGLLHRLPGERDRLSAHGGPVGRCRRGVDLVVTLPLLAPCRTGSADQDLCHRLASSASAPSRPSRPSRPAIPPIYAAMTIAFGIVCALCYGPGNPVLRLVPDRRSLHGRFLRLPGLRRVRVRHHAPGCGLPARGRQPDARLICGFMSPSRH